RHPSLSGTARPTLRTDVRVPRQKSQRLGIALPGFARRIQHRLELRLADRLTAIAQVLRLTGDRHVIRIQRRIHPAARGDGPPAIAWLENAVAPRAIAGV